MRPNLRNLVISNHEQNFIQENNVFFHSQKRYFGQTYIIEVPIKYSRTSLLSLDLPLLDSKANVNFHFEWKNNRDEKVDLSSNYLYFPLGT